MIYISTFLYACYIYLKENIYFENDNRKRGSGDNECSSFSGDALKGPEMDGGWNLKVSSIQSAPEDTLSRAGSRSLHRPRPAPWASRQCRDRLPTRRHPPQTPAKSASGPLPRRPDVLIPSLHPPFKTRGYGGLGRGASAPQSRQAAPPVVRSAN